MTHLCNANLLNFDLKVIYCLIVFMFGKKKSYRHVHYFSDMYNKKAHVMNVCSLKTPRLKMIALFNALYF